MLICLAHSATIETSAYLGCSYMRSYFIYVDAALATALEKSQSIVRAAKRKFQRSTEPMVCVLIEKSDSIPAD